MYISFSDTAQGRLGGAAQGIIPIQDADGTLLGGSAPSSPEAIERAVRRETKGLQNGMSKMEEHFERIMEAVERNTEQIATLAAHQTAREQAVVKSSPANEQQVGHFDMSSLSSHLARVNDLLEKHGENIEAMAKKQAETEDKLHSALQRLPGRENSTLVDMVQVSSHLDRIQTLMERNAANERSFTDAAPQTDFTPLTEKLSSMQEAVQQNSALIKELLEEGKKAGITPPAPPQPIVDLGPLAEHFISLKQALEQQSSHIQALVSFAAGDGDDGEAENIAGTRSAQNPPPLSRRPSEMVTKVLSALSEHMEQIYNAIEEGNMHAKTAGKREFGQLVEKMDGMTEAVRSLAQVQPLNERLDLLQKTLTQKIETPSDEFAPLEIKLGELLTHVEAMKALTQSSKDTLPRIINAQNSVRDAVNACKQTSSDKLDAVSSRLSGISTTAKQQQTRLGELVEAHRSLREAVVENGATSSSLDRFHEKLDLLAEHLESLREWAEFDSEQLKELVDAQKASTEAQEKLLEAKTSQTIDLGPLAGSLEAIRRATEENLAQMRALTNAKQQLAPSSEIDFTPLTERLNRINHGLQQQRESSSGTGDAKFIMSALSSHLSKIQAVTEVNAQHLKQHASRANTQSSALQDSVISTSNAIAALTSHTASQLDRSNERVEALKGQVRELMAGQRELIDVMRELATSITAQNKGSCDHIVVPPPRKVGRKIVGFVYDVKEGPVDIPLRGEGGVSRADPRR